MNSHSKQRGYVSLELVLVAGLILAVGFFSMLTFSTTGKDLMQNGLAKIEDFFGGGTGPLPTIIEYDENGYPESLNIQLSDVNSIDDFSVWFDDTRQGWVIDGYYGSDMTVVIPKFHPNDGFPLIEIDDGALDGLGLESVAIPDSITRIGEFAFSDNQLTSVIIPSSVATIGLEAFTLNQLTDVYLPVTTVLEEGGTFNGNRLPEDKAYFYSLDGKTLISYGGINATVTIKNGTTRLGYSSLEYVTAQSVSIPSTVTNLGDFVFYNSTITSIVLPNSITLVGDGIFAGASANTVVWTSGVTSIPAETFKNMNVNSVVIPEGVTTIGQQAFAGATLSSINFPSTLTSIEDMAFYDSGLTTVTIPSSVNNIGGSAFQGSNLYAVEFEGDLPVVGLYAFRDNPLLGKSILVPLDQYDLYVAEYRDFFVYRDAFYNPLVPETANPLSDFTLIYDAAEDGYRITNFLESLWVSKVIIPSHNSDGKPIFAINDSAFANDGIYEVVIPSTIESIGVSAFMNNNLSDIDIPSSVTFIGNAAFNNNLLPDNKAFFYVAGTGNTELAGYGGANPNIVIPSSVTTIGQSALTSLTKETFNITFPSGLTRIKDGAMSYSNFGNVVIPNTVTNMGLSVFSYSTLSSVTLSTGVSSIPNNTFQGTTMSSFAIPAHVTVIGSFAFNNSKIAAITIPQGVTHIGESAFRGNTYISSMIIPSSVTTIANSAFTSMSNLSSVRFQGNLPTTLGTGIFSTTTKLTTGKITVPAAQLAAYQAVAVSKFGKSTTNFAAWN